MKRTRRKSRILIRVMAWIEDHALRPMEKISQQKYLMAVREGIMSAFPLSLISSIFLFISVIPLPESWAIKQYLMEHEAMFFAPHRMTVFILTIYVVINVGANLARSYGYDQLSGGLIAVVSFTMTIVPINAAAIIPESLVKLATEAGLGTAWMRSIEDLGWVIPENSVAESGIFAGIIAAIYGVEIMHLCKRNNAAAKTKEGHIMSLVPPPVARTLETILPVSLVIFTLFILRDVLGFDLQATLTTLMQKIVFVGTTLPGALLLVFITTIFWTFGIRGLTMLMTASTTFWVSMMQENVVAHSSQMPLPNVAPLPFYQWFVWIGGAGATLSLVIMLCFSKARYLRKLGLTSLLPSLININEPVIYGVPLILNPYLSIPFIVGPMLSTVISYVLMQLNLVGRPFAAPGSMMPAPVGAYLATGDWRAVILCLFNMTLCGVIYYPFLKAYETKVQREGEENAAKLALSKDKPLKLTTVDENEALLDDTANNAASSIASPADGAAPLKAHQPIKLRRKKPKE